MSRALLRRLVHQRRALLLLSGGIDSPVAGHVLREQGFALEAVHFSLEPFTDDAAEEKAARLAAHIGISRLTVVPAGPLFAELTKHADHRLYFVLSKRLMVRIAAELARSRGIPFLATGENLGQVSSQTLTNLAAIDAAAPIPVLRPLLALDKLDIVRVAERIETFEISKGPEVCDVLGPKYPSTSARLDRVLTEEARLDIAALVAEGVKSARERRVAIERAV
ncbi:MAG: asparagine synthase-related protein [Thermoplasmatota archaeon]